MTLEDAWFDADREAFVDAETSAVVDRLSSAATRQGWHVEPEQHEEWNSSVEALQRELRSGATRVRGDSVDALRSALSQPGLQAYSDVILEYNLRRRGLRIDCVLLGDGIIAVVEFKRSKLASADRDQVMNYCVNLCEFHEETQTAIGQGVIVVPILVTTEGDARTRDATRFHRSPWNQICERPFECSADGLADALRTALGLRQCERRNSRIDWLNARFTPSSTILDAAISLYGEHDVSAIHSHAAPVRALEACTAGALAETRDALAQERKRIVFVSGAPGAGKTLVGLKLAFAPELRKSSVFVTGNAPLVEVLSAALKGSYQAVARRSGVTGYSREQAHHAVENATFKIVKAHTYLGDRRDHVDSATERVVIFDEAQRTYEKGRTVLRRRLPDHEADLILESLERSFNGGVVVVALIGHNQTINRGERGAVAWLEAAERHGWEFSIGDDTFALDEFQYHAEYRASPRRRLLETGHLETSLRFYRNAGVEQWSHELLADNSAAAREIAERLHEEDQTLWVTRSLDAAKEWVRQKRIGDERIGLIASAQGRRLSAYGLHVEYKPNIASWMLKPSGDPRSSNMLETVQNQYQVQGLELDYTVVCWGADLRRADAGWTAFKLAGPDWRRDRALEIAKSGYRVLLTRARKGMVLFVPEGSSDDPTRSPEFFSGVAMYLAECGARPLQ